MRIMQQHSSSETTAAVPPNDDADDVTTNVRIVKVMFPVIEDFADSGGGVDDTFANAIWPSWLFELIRDGVCDTISCSHFVSLVLAIAQIFGQMPVIGFRPTPHTTVKFHWRTLRVLWTFLYLTSSAAFTILFLWKSSRSGGINAKNMGMLKNQNSCHSERNTQNAQINRKLM